MQCRYVQVVCAVQVVHAVQVGAGWCKWCIQCRWVQVMHAVQVGIDGTCSAGGCRECIQCMQFRQFLLSVLVSSLPQANSEPRKGEVMDLCIGELITTQGVTPNSHTAELMYRQLRKR